MTLLPLTGRGGVRAHAIVDPELYDELSSYSWNLHRTGYALRKGLLGEGRRGQMIYLHRHILRLPSFREDPRYVDHINRDPLDCRLSNMRIVNATENARNRFDRLGVSGRRGVSWNKQSEKWQVAGYSGRDRKYYYLGLFENLDEAAEVSRAYRASRGLSTTGC